MKLIIAAAFALAAAVPAMGATLTDSAIFSANAEGDNWNSLIWNTQAPPEDVPNRWNMYYSSSLDPNSPTFINSGNDADTRISIDLLPGTYDFLVFGETVTQPLPAEQHYVLNLYFNGDQSAPGISGLYGPSCLTVCAAGHPNGLDLFGNSQAPEAGTLEYLDGTQKVLLSRFEWAIDDEVDQVWDTWAGPWEENYSGRPDYVGRIQLTVTDVAPIPLPAGIALFGPALALLAMLRRRRRS